MYAFVLRASCSDPVQISFYHFSLSSLCPLSVLSPTLFFRFSNLFQCLHLLPFCFLSFSLGVQMCPLCAVYFYVHIGVPPVYFLCVSLLCILVILLSLVYSSWYSCDSLICPHDSSCLPFVIFFCTLCDSLLSTLLILVCVPLVILRCACLFAVFSLPPSPS